MHYRRWHPISGNIRYVFQSQLWQSYLITNTEVLENFSKCSSKILPWVRFCNLNKIKKHRYRFSFMCEVGCECHISLVVRQGPCVGGEVQCSIVFLKPVSETSIQVGWTISKHTCSIFAIRWRTFTKTPRTTRETVSADGKWYSGLPVFIRVRNPWSLTIWKGLFPSATHCTISALFGYIGQLLTLVEWKCTEFPLLCAGDDCKLLLTFLLTQRLQELSHPSSTYFTVPHEQWRHLVFDQLPTQPHLPNKPSHACEGC